MTSGEESPPRWRAGDVLAGKYRVDRILAQGGMGVVVAAHHLQLDERVALKFLLPHAAGRRDAIARFMREARAAAKIKSEHVARVSDVGQLEDGSPFMVMEYLEGADLSDMIEKRGRVSASEAVDLVLQAMEAVAEAHAIGIVHRDLKPANLFCVHLSDGRPSVKVLDFGISKVTSDTGGDLTHTTAVVGSPLYMSPEQMQVSKGVDARTDIWSLGVILFELVTGQLPFNAEAVTELAIVIASAPAPALRGLAPDAPVALEAIVARCLEKDRAKRFQSVGELATALAPLGGQTARISMERVLGTLQKAGVPAPPSSSPSMTIVQHADALPAAVTAAMPSTSAPWTTASSDGARARGRRVAFAALAAMVLAGGAIAIVARSGHVAPAATPDIPSTAPVATAQVIREAITSDIPATPLAPPTPSASSASAVASASATAPPAARPGHAPSTHPSKPTPPASPASPKPSCNPPYVIDSSGYRQYKPECL